ncbi:MAG: hypothetical protein ABIW82_06380 [Dokdonella sp.]
MAAPTANGVRLIFPTTQAARAIPIPHHRIALNNQAEDALHKANLARQSSQLIDTLWPTDPSVKPTPWSAGLQDAIEIKSGRNPSPVFLTGIPMETYFPHGVQSACNAEALPNNIARSDGQWLAHNQQAVPIRSETSNVNTGKCVGCHASAGL